MAKGQGWGVYAHLDDKSLADVHKSLTSVANRLGAQQIQDKALKAAGKVILEGAKRRMPFKTGELRKSLELTSLKKFESSIGIDVVAKRGKSTPGGYYAHLVEYGHKVFKTTRFRRIRLSDAAPHPFMEPAFREEKESAIQEYKTVISTELEKLQKAGSK